MVARHRVLDQDWPRVPDGAGPSGRRRHRLGVRPATPVSCGVEPTWPGVSRLPALIVASAYSGIAGVPRALRPRGSSQSSSASRSRWCTRADRTRSRAPRHGSVSAWRDRSGYTGGVPGVLERRGQQPGVRGRALRRRESRSTESRGDTDCRHCLRTDDGVTPPIARSPLHWPRGPTCVER